MLKEEIRAKYSPSIGIETHVQLKTKTKLFCDCPNVSNPVEPNTTICQICMGLPGTLPVLNEEAVKLALRVGLALDAQIADFTKFDRKNYFYPDLPKGYQISQYDQPIVGEGVVKVLVDNKEIKVGVIRAHLEEDAGKLIHPEGANYSLVDLNRAGTPLMEIVSAPDIKTPAQAKVYVQELYSLMRYGQVSDADLYLGNMRFDVNVSVAKVGAKALGIRSEIKNLNSFRSVEKAAEYEINRQIEDLEKGGVNKQETRGWDEAKGKTYSMRSKEEAHDYRYFPEPDIPPLLITKAMIEQAKKTMPKLATQIRQDLLKSGLEDSIADVILANPDDVALLLKVKPVATAGVAKYLAGKVRAYRKEHEDGVELDPLALTELYEMQAKGEVGSSAVDEILEEMIKNQKGPREIAEAKHLLQSSDNSAIEKFVLAAIKANSAAVADYQTGSQNSLQFLVGQVMKESKGQANPQLVQKILKDKLSKRA